MRRKKNIISIAIVFGFYLLYSMIPLKTNLIKPHVRYNWYIAACLVNNSRILDNWTQQLLLLINELKPANVFVSIMENGDSKDNTIPQLNAFKIKLDKYNIQNTIVTTNIIKRSTVDRFKFLAAIRNEALKPLYNLTWNPNDTRIIYFNDIYYKVSDVINLINTNNMEYDFACGFDFYYSFYDVLVSSDLNKRKLMNHYPYFHDSFDQKLVRTSLPVRVFSGWNGMVIMKGTPFIKHHLKFREYGTNETRHSECYFICQDFWKLGFNRIYINPIVKVAYLPEFYYLHNYLMWPANIFMDWYYWLKGD